MRTCPPFVRIFVVGLSLHCGKDPILEAAETLEEETETPSEAVAKTEGEAPPVGEEGEPKPGIPEEPEPAPAGTTEQPEPPPQSSDVGKPVKPKPGVPKEPKPAPPGSPGGADHPGKDGGGGVQQEGPQVLLRGVVGGDPAGEGLIRIDLFDGDQRRTAGPRPKVVGVHEIPTMGPFEVSVSESTARVWIGAYRDLNQNNRPNQGEPFGWYSNNPVYLDDPPENIEINLTVEGKSRGLGVDFRE